MQAKGATFEVAKTDAVQFEYVYVDGEGSDKAISIVDNGKRISAVKGVALK